MSDTPITPASSQALLAEAERLTAACCGPEPACRECCHRMDAAAHLSHYLAEVQRLEAEVASLPSVLAHVWHQREGEP